MNYSKKCFLLDDGFYCEPLSDTLKNKILGKSYKEDCIIPYSDLRHIVVMHKNFDNADSIGELICNREIALDLLKIMYILYHNQYLIEKIRLIDEYNADDKESMIANNTSCFNYRNINGTNQLSFHAYGAAIDINPFYNPYCEPNGYTSPPGSEVYADRSKLFEHKIDENDLAYQLFQSYGFDWGGKWTSCKDYQHFEKRVSGMNHIFHGN